MSFFTESEERVLRALKDQEECAADEKTFESLQRLGFVFSKGSWFVRSGNGGDGTHVDDWTTEYFVRLTRAGDQAVARLPEVGV